MDINQDEVCKCAGMSSKNKYGKDLFGSECNEYKHKDVGVRDVWYSGRWCYVETSTCTDAREHPSTTLPGYGASRLACKSGRIKHLSVFFFSNDKKTSISSMIQ